MSHHVVPLRVYLSVFVALLVLLGVTIGAAFLNLGPLSALTALVIAIIKAVLIVLYFMHLLYSSRLAWLFAGAGFLWLIFLIVLSMSDYLTRGPLAFGGG